MQIYLARNNQQAGPYTLEQVNAMLANTQIVLTDLAWHEGMETWLPLGQLTGGKMVYIPSSDKSAVISPFSTPTTPSANKTAGVYSRTTSTKIDANHFFANGSTIANVGTRIGAAVVDLLTLLVITTIAMYQILPQDTIAKISAIMEKASSETTLQLQQQVYALIPPQVQVQVLLIAAVVAFVQILLIIWRGQSIGKILFKIRIVDEKSGLKAGFMQGAVLRTLLFNLAYNLPLVGSLIFMVDFISLFTEKNRTLHDRLAKTLVVNALPVQLEKPKS
ncbi:RDD family protein [Aquirhabdus parva]|uniref:RDD family protein n=1 Tax=Aquirhabdus parva TaxID=2283318 RepID=A0A345P5Z8_9GAMM|nr:RDD family protein [Aquirhabdus parva]AXI02707.1 RDD family protein [Aquirhabdus parva]